VNRIGFASAVAAATLFGVGGTFAQFLFQQRGVNIDWLVTMRLLSSGAVLLLISAMRQGRRILAVWRTDAVALILFGLLGMLAVQYTYMAAIQDSNTATATVLQFTAPAMIAVWLALAGRRLPSAREAAAIALAMLGTFFLVAHGKIGALSISPPALFWGVASAVAAAFNSLQPVRMLRTYGATAVGGWGMLVGGVALSFLHAPWKVEGVWDATAYGFTAFILLFGTLVAFYLYITALRLIGAQKSSLLTCAEPLSAAGLAVWWLGVSWGGMDWLGTACILATIVLLAKEQPETDPSEKVT
jgi:drug/metabolite transporter (DMT)-like permease